MDYSFGPQGKLQANILPSGSLWLHYGLGSSCFLSLPFSSRFLDQQCLWSLAPLGQLPNLSGSILLGGRRGRLKICQMTFGVNAIIVPSQPCNGRKLWLSASTTCARRPWPCSQLFHRDSPNDGDTDLINTIVQYSKKRRIPESV